MQRSPTACTDWQCRSTGRRSPPPTEARGREPGHVHFICVTCARGAVFTFYLMKSVGGPPSSDELRPVMGTSERVARWATGGYKCDVQADGRARVLTPSVWVFPVHVPATSQLRHSHCRSRVRGGILLTVRARGEMPQCPRRVLFFLKGGSASASVDMQGPQWVRAARGCVLSHLTLWGSRLVIKAGGFLETVLSGSCIPYSPSFVT